ncbi:MAG: cytochrome b [Hyphomicrobiaceae bacterium]|nr:cytochrome b [Hyphomicrobiaceae bacterium]MCC0023207.1 cytochrome b [Hyphomicrobiaceae bacterium]
MKTSDRYSWTQISLHWLIAVLVIFELFFNEVIESLWRSQRASQFALKPFNIEFWMNPHSAIGALILLLTLWRIWLRFASGAPAAPANEPVIFQWAAKLAHILFYLVLIAMPISGTIQLATGLPIAHQLHELGKPVLMLLIIVHVAAVLVHQFAWKNNIFNRMIGRA